MARPRLSDYMIEDVLQPWERVNGENVQAYEAFCTYRDMGTSRSILAAYHKQTGDIGKTTPPSKWINWSIQFEWYRRTLSYDNHLMRKAQEAAEREVLAKRQEAVNDFIERSHNSSIEIAKVNAELISKMLPAVQQINISTLNNKYLSSLLRTMGVLHETATNAEAFALGLDIALADKLESES